MKHKREEFLDELDAEFLPDGYHWRLRKPLIVDDSRLGRIEVPIGFETDLGSIPRIFWNILPPIGPASRAFALHDYLYATQKHSRLASDNALLRAMKAGGAKLLARWAIYFGVRLGGWYAWKEDFKKYGLSRKP